MAKSAATAAEEYRDEILQKLDDVCGIVYGGPDMSDEQIELLALLPVDDLEVIAVWAEEYAENVLNYATLARKAMEAKAQ